MYVSVLAPENAGGLCAHGALEGPFCGGKEFDYIATPL